MTDPTIRKQRELEARQRQEQLRIAEQAKAERTPQRQREPDTSERQRLAALEREWTSFKVGVTQAQLTQQREAYFQDLQQLVDDLVRTVNPPPLVEQPYVPPPPEGTGRLGYSDFNSALMVQPLRWFSPSFSRD